MHILIRWLIFAVSILVAAYLAPGVEVTLMGAFVLAIVLGLINAFLKPIITILTLPLTIVTLGLFSFVVNALMVLLAANFVAGFSVAGFWYALVFSVLLSLIHAVLSSLD